jgi:hypothetical protein
MVELYLHSQIYLHGVIINYAQGELYILRYISTDNLHDFIKLLVRK